MNKIITPKDIRELALLYYPELKDVILNNSIESSSTWDKGLRTGKSIEFITLISLLKMAKELGFSVEIPMIYFEMPSLFYQRNTVPYHHGAQAGHSHSNMDNIPLNLKFLASLTPKAIIKSPNSKTYLLFREGHPVHLIDYSTKNKGSIYFERPDIILCEAQIYNTINIDMVDFIYLSNGKEITGSLKPINQPTPPLIKYHNNGINSNFVSGIIECSVGKNATNANQQLFSYQKIFNSNAFSALVNGKVDIQSNYDVQVSVDLHNYSADLFTFSLNYGMREFIQKLV
ncbi:hypothetical protein OHK33_12920 [Pectobacterium aroidearum]|uniref:hypothetical protein n=1 Tax=Pectobacterium aroidearum TaxID=1201031 RepID=UPI003306B013